MKSLQLNLNYQECNTGKLRREKQTLQLKHFVNYWKSIKYQLKIFLVLIQINFISTNVNSQITFYQEILNGEVSFIGTSSGDGNATITLPTNLADGTTPKKVFFICHGQKGNNYIPTFKKFKIDGNPFLLDTLNPSILLVGNNTIPSGDYNGHVTYIVDLTNYINVVNSSIEIEWIYDGFFPPNDCPGCHIAAPTLLIINENISLPKISISLILNNKNNDDIINLNIENLNQANFSFPIGLGIQTDRLGASIVDGYNFEINNQNAGSISTTDPDLYCIYSGAIGCFHYGNNVLIGLTGDTPDSLFSGTDPLIHNADGLIDMNSYLNNVVSPIDFEFSYNGGIA